jgi:predicted branched-subunit amino acid permease
MDRHSYLQGFRDGAPFLLVIVPFGAVFGIVGTESGLNLAEVMGFSVLVIAGAAQFAAVQMMTENAPVIIVLAASLAVNLRMAMYSASMAPHLGQVPFWKRGIVGHYLIDQTFATSILKFESTPDMTINQRMWYFFGTATPICLPWYLATWAGAALGTQIPASLPIDFAMPITFLAMIGPMLRTLAHVGAALVSIAVTLALGFLPYNLGLLVAAACAMAAGAALELWQTRRARR